ncbi:KH domain-containing protein [Atopobacter sp. AH10]|uniref:KH domain-containing protein n=1 Tax=Atopobacter sp. AH10 TaxID=2315861 RepID=UPI000EF25774|nr:KH domain-containing protein [Atopobacter sp. AH10]RLK63279.1 KH domain-containing protein [Atopobacter sp. AH10]
MPDVEELILTIVKPLVEHQDDVELKSLPGGRYTEYELSVHPDDIGRVIGKKGRVARAIRTIVYSVRAKDGKKVRLTILDPNE